MSKETDIALKHLLFEILNNIESDDVLANTSLRPNGSTRRSVAASIRKARKLIARLSIEEEMKNIGGQKYKNTFIKDVRSAKNVRETGRRRVDGSSTPENEWGGFELLSYFLEKYYNKVGSDFPLETPGVVYKKFKTSSNEWITLSTRGLSVMWKILKIFGSPEVSKEYIDWWFNTSMTDRYVSWGWLCSPSSISIFQSQRVKTNKTLDSTAGVIKKDKPLPESFITWVRKNDPDAFNYASSIKTFKQLKYIYNAWASKLNETDHPVVIMLHKAIEDGIL